MSGDYRPIGLVCWCRHDVLDHESQGCRRCLHVESRRVVKLLEPRHRFQPIEWLRPR